MAEARRMHLKQMSGIAVGMLLQPSKGVRQLRIIDKRDDLIRAGGVPKDHITVNRRALKTQQAENKLKKEV